MSICYVIGEDKDSDSCKGEEGGKMDSAFVISASSLPYDFPALACSCHVHTEDIMFMTGTWRSLARCVM